MPLLDCRMRAERRRINDEKKRERKGRYNAFRNRWDENGKGNA